MVNAARGRQQRVGTVLSDKNAQTIVVGVEWSRRHPLYHKQMRRRSKFVAHDANGEAKRGDTVLIEETRPLSATKRWRLVRVIAKGELADISPDQAAAAGTPELATPQGAGEKAR
jgi:small subunit ribosomal protein S17